MPSWQTFQSHEAEQHRISAGSPTYLKLRAVSTALPPFVSVTCQVKLAPFETGTSLQSLCLWKSLLLSREISATDFIELCTIIRRDSGEGEGAALSVL